MFEAPQPKNISQVIASIPNHPGDIPEGTLRAILKQTGIDPDDFVNK
ncbi:MAG: type II toxin-antitoxin system HicA family toxin [Pseudomonadota bacterium]